MSDVKNVKQVTFLTFMDNNKRATRELEGIVYLEEGQTMQLLEKLECPVKRGLPHVRKGSYMIARSEIRYHQSKHEGDTFFKEYILVRFID